ncbi:dephospho-CoA kinase [Alkalibacterium pelagium]|uniref:Dephospho-CoA kinase n=1 Tax=Alkalibacterium pelagium TaxID=426702 RepID=A0A1H7NDF2_9LACT|nr:dephospho-CoA kinase [Alkalibacterium pelagium]GEN51363.1 dephospho-CoA kinase [Alkalibacterium pelagium]SEL21530.1 dephospho-CoA kinase [Alkalibacterium pelagium]
MTFILGLTGGIATGKSTVSRFFESQGIPVVDADKGARLVMEPGQAAYHAVVKAFGQEILTEDGAVDRTGLGAIVFNDPAKLSKLNETVHSHVLNWIRDEKSKLIKADHSMIVLDIPLLYEIGLESEVDAVMVVYVDPQTQLKRLMKRDGLSDRDAQKRIDAQKSIDIKAEKADVIIDNRGSIEETEDQLRTWLDYNGY